MSLKKEIRDGISRYYSVDTSAILYDYNRSRDRELEYVDYREKWEQPFPLIQFDKPLEITLELNNYCNMACAMCYRNYLPIEHRIDMSDELLESILDFV